MRSTARGPLAIYCIDCRQRLVSLLRECESCRAETMKFAARRLRWENQRPEPKSSIPSSWVGLEEHCILWGIPAGFRLGFGSRTDDYFIGRQSL